MYDAVADGLPLASAGENRKKAMLVISDGNDSQQRRRASANCSN